MNFKRTTAVVMLVMMFAALPAWANSDTTKTDDREAGRNHHRKKQPETALTIESPKFGQSLTGATAKVTLELGRDANPRTLRVYLNGKDVTSRFGEDDRFDRDEPATLFSERDGGRGREESVTLATSDGLRRGENTLRAVARGKDRHIEVRRVKFDYYDGLGAGENLLNWLPSTVGLQLNPGGAQPWVSMTTGTPASLQDNTDQTKYSIPYADRTFPTSQDTPCTTTYQIVVLNRQSPALEDAYMCAADSATLKNDLAGLANGTEIVLVGTTLNNNADAGLDTTAIGGTDYSQPGSWQPMGYAAIGVPGAAPGSAYEDYDVSADRFLSVFRVPQASGILALDQNSNYNFHPGENLQFQVYPNNPNWDGQSTLFVNFNGTVVPWRPPNGSANGFWLLTLDRRTAIPDESNKGFCQFPSGGACGQFFPTGSADPSIASVAIQELATSLRTPSTRTLIVLTTFGQPFQSATAVTEELMSAFGNIGGSNYTLQSLTTPTSTYTLIAPGTVLAPGTVGALTTLTPFSRGVVNSSSAFSQQGQTGFVRGVMARSVNGQYFPVVASQEDGSGNAQGATVLSVDYDFYSISSQFPMDWRLTDTTGHIAAYHYASAFFLQFRFNETESHSQDLRYFYAGHPEYGQYNTDFLCSLSGSNCPPYPGNGHGFTAQDLADANAQLYSELTALNDTNTYLGDAGIGGLMNSSGSGVSDLVIQATFQALNGQVGAVASTPVKINSFDWMALLSGVTTIGSAALGVDFPVAAAALGVTSGALSTGAAMAPWATNNPATPPSYENTFDTTLGELETSQETFAENLVTSYDTALDNVYSDWGKLQATGAKTANSDSGWSFDSQLTPDKLGTQLAAGASRSTYLQVLPQFYRLDSYIAQPITSIDKLGTLYHYVVQEGQFHFDAYACTASYPAGSLASQGYIIYPSSEASGIDMFVIGGTINNQGTKNVTESLPSQSLITTLFDAPADSSTANNLNFPMDLLFANAEVLNIPLARNGLLMPRQGPDQGFGQCYKPGCNVSTRDDPNAKQTCTGP